MLWLLVLVGSNWSVCTRLDRFQVTCFLVLLPSNNLTTALLSCFAVKAGWFLFDQILISLTELYLSFLLSLRPSLFILSGLISL